MEKSIEADPSQFPQPSPAGGVPLAQERLQAIAEQWERTRQNLRTMDDAALGETEPATLFVWEGEER